MPKPLTRIHDPETAAAIPRTAALVGQQVARAALLAERTIFPSGQSVQSFVDPEAQVSATEQLDTTVRIWRTLGCAVPLPSDSQLRSMSELADAYPSHRIVPVRFLGRAGRAAIDRIVPNRPQLFPGASGDRTPLTTRHDPLYVPDTSWRKYGRLLEQPETTVEEGDAGYGMRYKAPSGLLTTRMLYDAELRQGGQAIAGERGATWSFPMIDIAERKPLPAALTAAEMYESVSPWATPEAEIVLGLLSEMAGRASSVPGGQLNLVNEAIYFADDAGETGELAEVASIDWYPGFQEAAAYGAATTNSAGNFRVANAMSALAA